jgi:hypothetical protein
VENYTFTSSYTGPDLDAVSQCLRSATMPRSKSESGIAGTGALRNPFPVAAEILSEEPHDDERVESETAIAQQIPNFHTRSKGERLLCGWLQARRKRDMSPSLEAGDSDRQLAALLNHQPNFVDGA